MDARCKREQAPAYWLRTMREEFRRRLTFHGVGVGPEDFYLLEQMCDVAGVSSLTGIKFEVGGEYGERVGRGHERASEREREREGGREKALLEELVGERVPIIDE